MLTFNVPPGIGDISWIYCKLASLGRPFQLNICENHTLNRACGFVDILPGVVNGGYKNFSYSQAFLKDKLGLAPDTDIYRLPDGEYYLSANLWLDAGNRIEGFLPTLEPQFHYELATTDQHKENARKAIEGLPRPLIVIYTSKYVPPETGWHLWSPDEWAQFCRRLHEHFDGKVGFAFIGAKFDTTIGHEAAEKTAAFAPAVNLIGKTEVGDVVEIIREADYLVAFPSGMGILGDVIDTPTMMFLPHKLRLLKDTYADPKNIESGRHINTPYLKVDEAFGLWKKTGLPHMEILK